MKINILTILIVLFTSFNAFAQLDSNTKAKLYFTEAEKLYNQGDFDESFKYLKKTDEALNGKKVARTLALLIKLHYAGGSFIYAKKMIDIYTSEYMESASKELNDEILALYINIEEGAEKQKQNNKKEKERIESILGMSKNEIYEIVKENYVNTELKTGYSSHNGAFIESYTDNEGKIIALYRPYRDGRSYNFNIKLILDLNKLKEVEYLKNHLRLTFNYGGITNEYKNTETDGYGNKKTRSYSDENGGSRVIKLPISKSKSTDLYFSLRRLIELNN